MKTSQTHYPSFVGFLLFAIATLLLFTLSLVLGLSVLFVYLTESVANVQSAIYSATIFFSGALLGVVSIISLLRFLNKPAAHVVVSTTFEGWKIAAGITGAGLALLLGNWVRENQSVNWLLLPLLTIPAVMFPIWTLTGLSTKGLSLGTRWRTWGALGVSLTVTPFILFMLEVFVLVVIFFFIVFYAVTNPEVAAEFERLSTQFAFIDMQSEEALRLITPYLMKPVVVIPVAVFIAILIPLMEELLKPLVVWFLARKLDSAAQGFAFGALSGAGFAIWETFNVSGQIAEWGILLFTRIGTGLLHITTSALMGAAIYAAIRERRYAQLFGTYLLAVLLHGLWNASAITVSFSALAGIYTQADSYTSLQWIATAGLAILAVVMLTILITSNRRLQKTIPVNIPEETPSPQNDTNI